MRGYLVRARFRYLNAQITLIQKRWRKSVVNQLRPRSQRTSLMQGEQHTCTYMPRYRMKLYRFSAVL